MIIYWKFDYLLEISLITGNKKKYWNTLLQIYENKYIYQKKKLFFGRFNLLPFFYSGKFFSHVSLICILEEPSFDPCYHGRLQTFFQGRAKFSRGAKTYYLPKKHLKTYYFSLKKVKKHTILAGQGGQGPPLALPCGRPCMLPNQKCKGKNSAGGTSTILRPRFYCSMSCNSQRPIYSGKVMKNWQH